jgi:hypothetical protein
VLVFHGLSWDVILVSLDYPYYEELLRRRHPAAWWWIVGDRLYYLGLIATIMGAATPFQSSARFGSWGYTRPSALKTGAITHLGVGNRGRFPTGVHFRVVLSSPWPTIGTTRRHPAALNFRRLSSYYFHDRCHRPIASLSLAIRR